MKAPAAAANPGFVREVDADAEAVCVRACAYVCVCSLTLGALLGAIDLFTCALLTVSH